ncbi:MAG TPA: hypothetical protein VIO36_01805 [Anaerolineaceae bacterium]
MAGSSAIRQYIDERSRSMFSFLSRKKKKPQPEEAVTCPACSALLTELQAGQNDVICPACGKKVDVQTNCGKFT